MLEGLRKELEGIDLNDPEVVKLGENLGDLEEGDEPAGMLDEESIKLLIFIGRMKKRSMQIMLEHAMAHLNGGHDDEACEAFKAKFVEHATSTKILEDMCWGIFRLDHGLLNAGSLGIRKSWQVVKSKPKPEEAMGGAMIEVLTMSGPEDMAELLSALGGGRQRRHGHGGGCSGCN